MEAVRVLALRSACALAVTGALVAGNAVAQAREKVDPAQVPKAGVTQQVGQAKPSSAKKDDKPAASVRNAKKPRAAAAKKPKSTAARKKSTTKRPAVAAKRKPQPRTAAKAAATRPAGTVARRPAPLPPPLIWTPPPLGPERFYPNGIPELRPEFLHPEPGAPVPSDPVATSPQPRHPELLP